MFKPACRCGIAYTEAVQPLAIEEAPCKSLQKDFFCQMHHDICASTPRWMASLGLVVFLTLLRAESRALQSAGSSYAYEVVSNL
jgi:hypothetical protein